MKAKIIISMIMTLTLMCYIESYAQDIYDTLVPDKSVRPGNKALLQTGNVGVGTDTPPANFSILGDYNNPSIPGYSSTGVLRIGVGENDAIDIGKMGDSPFSGWIQAGYDGLETDPLSLQPMGGNVGIGTSNPAARLHVYGGDALVNGLTIGKGGGSVQGNSALGEDALFSNTTGNYNTAGGYTALYSNTKSNYNTAFGAQALYYDSLGSYNTASGYQALRINGSGSGNTATGYRAMRSLTTGNINCAFGQNAMNSTTTGRSNVAVGTHALYSNTTGSFLVAIGDSALYHNNSIEYGDAIKNTAVGSKSLYSNSQGSNNTATGFQSLYYNSTGDGNTAFGSQALYSNVGGMGNTGIGYGALRTNINAYNNTAVGHEALLANTEGDDNTAIGRWAMFGNMSGDDNTAVGYAALHGISYGDNNTAVGKYSGTGDFSGSTINPSNSTFIGYNASISFLCTNATGIGYEAHPDDDDQVRIGNSSILEIGGYADWTNLSSDGKYISDVQENVAGLDFIMKLRPVTYRVDAHKLAAVLGEGVKSSRDGKSSDDKPSALDLESRNAKSQVTYSGFVAQEVEEAARTAGYDFSGINKPEKDDGQYGLTYAEFVVPLVKALQEQQEIIENQQRQIDELLMRVSEIENR